MLDSSRHAVCDVELVESAPTAGAHYFMYIGYDLERPATYRGRNDRDFGQDQLKRAGQAPSPREQFI